MPKQSKGTAPPELLKLRETLAANLRAYMVVKYGPDTADTAMAADLGSKSGVGKNTVLRALGVTPSDSDIRLDTLVRLAKNLGAAPIDLLRDHASKAPSRRRKQSSAESVPRGHRLGSTKSIGVG